MSNFAVPCYMFWVAVAPFDDIMLLELILYPGEIRRTDAFSISKWHKANIIILRRESWIVFPETL